MNAVLMVDGLEFVEQPRRAVVVAVSDVVRAPVPMAQREFLARMENWRSVVMGATGSSAAVCSAWAKWYVALRTSEAPPDSEVRDEKCRPLRPLVSADVLDAWLIEEAWRKLGDFNDRMALKCRYVFGFDDARTRTKLRGVRGPHVRLVIARAENNLQTILKKLDNPNKIRPTTCLPGCPVPTAESASP